MKKKNLIILSLALVFMMLTAIGCSSKKDESKDNDETVKTLRIGVMQSSDIIPLAMIDELKLDEKHGFDLKMEVFKSAGDRDAALQAGELDGVFTDYIGVCIYQNAGLDVKITGVTDGDYVLIAGANSGITSLEDMKGKSIAISQNTLIEYALDYILQEKGYGKDYVVKEIVARIPDRLEMLRAGKIDLGLLPDPFSTIAQDAGGVVLGSANSVGLYPAVSAFTGSALESNKDVIKSYYNAYNEAVEYINKTPIEKYEDVVIKAAGFPEELKGKIQLPTYRTNTLPSKEDLEKAIKWASDKGLCDKALSADKLLYDLNK